MTDPYGQQPNYNPDPGYGQQPYGQPGYGPPFPGYGAAYPAPPENNLVWGILTTVLCCLPLGIVSIIKANEVNRLWAQGQYQAAHESAEAAKKWAIWGALAPLIVFALIMIVSLVIGGIGAVSSSY